jgi:hypothetical protein
VGAPEVIGNADDAWSAYMGWHETDEHDTALIFALVGDNDPRLHKRIIGQGERRTAWLVNGIVYKVGRRGTNIWEHELLTEWRATGAQWAPATTLWEWTDGFGDKVAVVAMPYLPDDGGKVNEATLADIRKAAPNTCRENYVSHGGRTYLIDGEDIEGSPR